MLNRLTVLLFLSSVMLSSFVRAQNQAPPSADQQAMRDQMQQNFQTIMQNMQDKGIDPQQFFQQIRDGADPADIQKQLVDKGVIDQKMITQMQTDMQKMTLGRIKDQLGATDEEWAALAPLIQKVTTASSAFDQTRGGGMGGGMGGFMTVQSPSGADLAKATRQLRAAIKDPSTPADRFTTLLRAYREARDKARAELLTARSELISVLSVRQEGLLTTMGILE